MIYGSKIWMERNISSSYQNKLNMKNIVPSSRRNMFMFRNERILKAEVYVMDNMENKKDSSIDLLRVYNEQKIVHYYFQHLIM